MMTYNLKSIKLKKIIFGELTLNLVKITDIIAGNYKLKAYI